MLALQIAATLAVLGVLAWMNWRTTTRTVYLRYHPADFFEFGTRATRGWPLAMTHFEPADNVWRFDGEWVLHPIRGMVDLVLLIALPVAAFLVCRLPAALIANGRR